MVISPVIVSSQALPAGRKLTGWRGEIDNETKIQKRVELDLYYIENWSMLFDLYILWRTPPALLRTENAY
jgi:lipopolysaccharide/colanic/teichoic acid biosynthesis glycosyltransferase